MTAREVKVWDGTEWITPAVVASSNNLNGVGVPSGGTTNQLLKKTSDTDFQIGWTDAPTELPSQTSNSGKFLTTNGSSPSWATVDALPSQSNNSGKYLTTNGSTASWSTVTAGVSIADVFMMMGA